MSLIKLQKKRLMISLMTLFLLVTLNVDIAYAGVLDDTIDLATATHYTYSDDRIEEMLNHDTDFIEFINEKLDSYIQRTGYYYVIYLGARNIRINSLGAINIYVAFYSDSDIYMYNYQRPNYVSGLSLYSPPKNSSFLYMTSFRSDAYNLGYYDDLEIESLFEDTPGYSGNIVSTSNFSSSVFTFDVLPGYYFNFPYKTNANLILKNSMHSSPEYTYNLIFVDSETIVRENDIVPTYTGLIDNYTLKSQGGYDFKYNGTDSMKYLDVYIDSESFNKNIHYNLNVYDLYDCNNDSLHLCTNGAHVIDLLGYDISYLIYENGIYKWVDSDSIEDTLYTISNDSYLFDSSDNVLRIKGSLSTKYNYSDYNIVEIKYSFKFSNAFNFYYEYYDDSNVTSEDIEIYYNSMLIDVYDEELGIYNNLRLYRSKMIDKYVVFSTDREEYTGAIWAFYHIDDLDRNSAFTLMSRGFNSLTKESLEQNKHNTNNIFKYNLVHYGNYKDSISNNNFGTNEFYDYYGFIIGSDDHTGIYLYNYLYHNYDWNLGSYVNLYIPADLYFSYSDYLDEAVFIDEDNNIDFGIMQSPDDETDNRQFTDNFRKYKGLLNELHDTRVFMNNSFYTLFGSLPFKVRLLIEFLYFALCLRLTLSFMNWGDV